MKKVIILFQLIPFLAWAGEGDCTIGRRVIANNQSQSLTQKAEVGPPAKPAGSLSTMDSSPDQDGLGICSAMATSVLLKSALPGNPDVSHLYIAMKSAMQVTRMGTEQYDKDIQKLRNEMRDIVNGFKKKGVTKVNCYGTQVAIDQVESTQKCFPKYYEAIANVENNKREFIKNRSQYTNAKNESVIEGQNICEAINSLKAEGVCLAKDSPLEGNLFPDVNSQGYYVKALGEFFDEYNKFKYNEGERVNFESTLDKYAGIFTRLNEAIGDTDQIKANEEITTEEKDNLIKCLMNAADKDYNTFSEEVRKERMQSEKESCISKVIHNKFKGELGCLVGKKSNFSDLGSLAQWVAKNNLEGTVGKIPNGNAKTKNQIDKLLFSKCEKKESVKNISCKPVRHPDANSFSTDVMSSIDKGLAVGTSVCDEIETEKDEATQKKYVVYQSPLRLPKGNEKVPRCKIDEGTHSMAVVGYKCENGTLKCEVQNSWGDDFFSNPPRYNRLDIRNAQLTSAMTTKDGKASIGRFFVNCSTLWNSVSKTSIINK